MTIDDAVDRIALVDVGPNDTLVVFCPGKLSDHGRETLNTLAKRAFSLKRPIVVLEEGMTLGVVRADDGWECYTQPALPCS